MLRYVVVPDEYPHLAHVSEEHDDGGVFLGEDVALTLSQAHIIAWALNAVAEGRLLFSSNRHSPDVREYDGPTEGIAP